MKALPYRATHTSFTLIVLIGFLTIALASEKKAEPIAYSSYGHGPELVLLHNSQEHEENWINAAKQLANRFQIIVIDLSQLPDHSVSTSIIHDQLEEMGVRYARISGAPSGEEFAQRYALAYPNDSRSFLLPQSSEDLKTLTDLLNSTHIL
ncbi:hypothetical protein [Pelagicoccus sp. SDUM812003]|uniref:alpha/beta fold hydrolase n=1 Tax=Pelagicoccus sp. SDUM812003 TaxID=3041267 RepID=UPI00280D32D5|nr:hypothetical protein [Pelagicoccus sp. SDUM812003]MDQ8202730.1 hypothetical protein [Pelagicoccus sp. SDUM812003]